MMVSGVDGGVPIAIEEPRPKLRAPIDLNFRRQRAGPHQHRRLAEARLRLHIHIRELVARRIGRVDEDAVRYPLDIEVDSRSVSAGMGWL